MKNNLGEEMKWYAAFVETGHEDQVKERLEYRFNEELSFYVPKRQIKERKCGTWQKINHTLFPGYLLINGNIQDRNIACFKNVPGLWRLLSDENQPLTIPNYEISFINKLMSKGEVIGPSSVFAEGDNIKVIDGPLMGMEGLIKSIDKRKGRAKVIISFLGEERVIDFSVDIIAKL